MPQYKRYKLLLDEMMPRRNNFPQLNNLHDLKHIVHDFKKPSLKDYQIIEIARRAGRIIVTKNVKHFKELCMEKKIDLIGVVELASYEEIDRKISAYLKRRKGYVMAGKFVNIIQSSSK